MTPEWWAMLESVLQSDSKPPAKPPAPKKISIRETAALLPAQLALDHAVEQGASVAVPRRGFHDGVNRELISGVTGPPVGHGGA